MWTLSIESVTTAVAVVKSTRRLKTPNLGAKPPGMIRPMKLAALNTESYMFLIRICY